MTHSAFEKQFSFLLYLISSLSLLKASKYRGKNIKRYLFATSWLCSRFFLLCIKTTSRWSCHWSKRCSETCKGFLVNSCVLMGLKGSFLLVPALAGRSSRAKTRLKALIGSSSQQLVLKTMGRLFLNRAVHSFNVHCLLFIRSMPRSALGEHEALCCCTQQPHTDVPPQEHGKNPKKWPIPIKEFRTSRQPSLKPDKCVLLVLCVPS